MMVFLKSIIFFILIVINSSCGATKNTSFSQSENRTPCDTAKQILKIEFGSQEFEWLDKNEIDCNRIQQFLELWGNSNDSVEYIKGFLKLKLSDDEYKLERFIELYCLLKQNPNALIDGTLPLEKQK